jgi:hypothetical protein
LSNPDSYHRVSEKATGKTFVKYRSCCSGRSSAHASNAIQQTNPSSINKENGFSQKSAQQQNDNPEKDSPGSVTSRQIGLIRVKLKQQNIPEKVFCSSHDIARIENLSLNEARAIIMNEDF